MERAIPCQKYLKRMDLKKHGEEQLRDQSCHALQQLATCHSKSDKHYNSELIPHIPFHKIKFLSSRRGGEREIRKEGSRDVDVL
jgi:hypothetical protein